MSVIDKKGKLFGKLNIIDLIAIILIIAVIALLGYKLTSNRGPIGGAGVPVVYTVEVKGVDEEVYQFIESQLPSQLMASNEMLDAKVTKVEATPVTETEYMLETQPGTTAATLKLREAGDYDLVFTIEGTVKNNLTSELGTQEIRVGKSHIVKTDTFELEGGVILSCERGAAQ